MKTRSGSGVIGGGLNCGTGLAFIPDHTGTRTPNAHPMRVRSGQVNSSGGGLAPLFGARGRRRWQVGQRLVIVGLVGEGCGRSLPAGRLARVAVVRALRFPDRIRRFASYHAKEGQADGAGNLSAPG